MKIVSTKLSALAFAASMIAAPLSYAGEGEGAGASNLGQTLFNAHILALVAHTHVSSYDADCDCTFTPSANALSGIPTEFRPSPTSLVNFE